MKLDRTKEPMVHRVQGGVTVILYLVGDEDSGWKKDYDAAAERRGIDARASAHIPWGITLTITDPNGVEDALNTAVEVIVEANQAWTERNKARPTLEYKVTEWWKLEKLDRPPPRT